MATFDGATEVRVGAPGPWAQRRIAFHATSTYASAPAMEPLNEPFENGASGGGNHHNPQYLHQQQYQQQQQQQQQQRQPYQHSPHANGGSKPGHSEPLSLPSSMPLHWTAPQKIGAGLSNLGNTCFLNSVLQCLTYTPPLAGYLQSGQHKASCRVAGFCAFCALQEHVQQALASSGKVVSPQKLAKNLRSICRSFRMGRQEDSHEYMRYLLDALHKCCLPPDLAKNSNSKSSQEKSLVYRIFGGQLRSQVKCTACSHCSNTYDPFLDLSLEIVRADSVTKALARFTAVDVLDGDNKYKCPRCKKKVRALKHFTIDLVPNILTIQFKRFSSTGGQGGKIDKKVEFGTTLDLKPFVSNGPEGVPKYKLFGVLVHSGWSTHSGHYYSFLRASSDIWHVFDDSRVRQVSEKTVLDQKAYMLFYVREGKRVMSSHSEPPPAAKQQALPPRQVVAQAVPRQVAQALPRQVALLSKERQANSDSGVPVARALTSQPTNTFSKDSNSERKPLAEVQRKDPPNPINSSKDKEGREGTSAAVRVIVKQAPPQSLVSAPQEEPSRPPIVNSNESNGHRLDTPPTTNASTPQLPVTNPPVLHHTTSEEAATAVPPAPQVAADSSLTTEENAQKNETEMEIDTSCTVSGDPGFEEEWDEYYKKGWNPPGTTPQKFLKMLRVIPHTRRYYQARARPPKRTGKVASNGTGELLENGHSDLPTETWTPPPPTASASTKRPQSFNEDARGGPKRQQKDLGRNSLSSTCMASEEFLASKEPVDVPSFSNENGTGNGNGHGNANGNGTVLTSLQENRMGLPENRMGLPENRMGLPENRMVLPENRPQSRGQASSIETGLVRDNFGSSGVVEEGQRVAKRPFGPAVENGQAAQSNGRVEVSRDQVKEPLGKGQYGGRSEGGGGVVESRVDRDVENCQPSVSGDCGPHRNPSSIRPSSEKGAAETSTEAVMPMAPSSLYGTSVPRWGEVNGDEKSVKEIERLLEREKNGSFERDTWDVEYDRGRSKKVRNKTTTGKEQSSYVENSNGIVSGIIKPSNPFQSIGFAKKMGTNGIKKGNSIGFKAGYGYGLKTGKNVGSTAGPQTTT